jgi:hypothetical protein
VADERGISVIQIINRSVGSIDVTRIMDGEDKEHRHRAVWLKWTQGWVSIYPKAKAWRRTLPRGSWIVSNGPTEIRAEFSGTYPNWLLTRRGKTLPKENVRIVLSDDDNRELGLGGRILVDQMLEAASGARPGISVRTLK